jgi:four helix bundle protein
MPPTLQFDHEKLDVYKLELRFVTWAMELIEKLRFEPRSTVKEVVQQLDRASLSSLLNTAEGNGRRKTQQRARFFDDARGSATECAACLDALVAKRTCQPDRVAEGKGMLLRVVSMLSKLVVRFDKASNQDQGLREDEVDYQLGSHAARTFEDEDDND